MNNGGARTAAPRDVALQATQEGLVPLKNWLKSALEHVICVCMGEPGLGFVWVGDNAIEAPAAGADAADGPTPPASRGQLACRARASAGIGRTQAGGRVWGT